MLLNGSFLVITGSSLSQPFAQLPDSSFLLLDELRFKFPIALEPNGSLFANDGLLSLLAELLIPEKISIGFEFVEKGSEAL